MRPKTTRMDPQLQTFLEKSAYRIAPDRYCYLKTVAPPTGPHFAVIVDEEECTVITTEQRGSLIDKHDERGGFRLIGIKPSIPFEGVGFLAAIAGAVAEQGLNILVVSTFSKDYILVPEEELSLAEAALRGLGLKQQWS
jgi:hypothetical protein